jgi:hypothetical protein
MYETGGKLLEKLLNSGDRGYQGARIKCDCGGFASFTGYREKHLHTILGNHYVPRAYYYCDICKHGIIPLDKTLDIEGTSYSPGLRRLSCYVGAKDSFASGSEELRELAGIEVSVKEVERIAEEVGAEIRDLEETRRERIFSGEIIMLPVDNPPAKVYIEVDGTGIPVVAGETYGRQGKGEDGKAHTREAKLGCVFTQTALDQKGKPVRDEASTTYVGIIETADEVGRELYAEVERRGFGKVETKIVLGDGAVWIWEMAQTHFPGAIEILDIYHAREHLWNVGCALYGDDKKRMDKWVLQRIKELDKGDIASIMKAFGRVKVLNNRAREVIKTEANFFKRNRNRMRYDYFRSLGLFVGSGVIEASCRTVIGERLKKSGMWWTVRGANAIISLRRCFLSGEWEDYWESRISG